MAASLWDRFWGLTQERPYPSLELLLGARRSFPLRCFTALALNRGRCKCHGRRVRELRLVKDAANVRLWDFVVDGHDRVSFGWFQ